MIGGFFCFFVLRKEKKKKDPFPCGNFRYPIHNFGLKAECRAELKPKKKKTTTTTTIHK
jgi:hypothetical protein